MHPSDPLVDALARTAFDTTTALTQLAAEHDLTLAQLRMLGVLRDRTVRMTDLAGYLGLEKSSLSGLVERAETRGLLVRTRSESDGRVVEVSRTSAGRTAATRMASRARALVLPTVDGLSATEQRQLRTLLERAAEHRLSAN